MNEDVTSGHNLVVMLVSWYGSQLERLSKQVASLQKDNALLVKGLAEKTRESEERWVEIGRLVDELNVKRLEISRLVDELNAKNTKLKKVEDELCKLKEHPGEPVYYPA